MTEDDIEDLVRRDPWMMRVLTTAEEVNLPDWWIGAGFLRNAVWDHLTGRAPLHDSDIDLVYFDASNTDPEKDWQLEDKLNKDSPFAKWEVRNQARMHQIDGFSPYTSTADGIAHFVETATCVGIRSNNGELEFLYCYGPRDLLEIVARPIPQFQDASKIDVFRNRITKKQWRTRWPQLRVEEAKVGPSDRNRTG